MIHRTIEHLDPRVRDNARAFVDALTAQGYRYTILETRREYAVQMAYYAQGRENPEIVSLKRATAGLPPISDAEAGRIITWTKHSYHLDGLAMDVAPLLPNGMIPWVIKDATIAALWMSLGELGEKCGFAWGGRWDPKDKWGLGRDLPHFEVRL